MELLTRYFTIPDPSEIQFDARTRAMLLIGFLSQAGIVGASFALKDRTYATVPKGSTDPAFPFIWVIMLITFTLTAVLIYRYWDRLPEWFRTAARTTAAFAAIGLISYPLIDLGAIVYVAGLAAVFTVTVLEDLDLGWLIHNCAALVLVIVGTVGLGYRIHPAIAVIFMLLTLLWDFVAVDKSGVMEDAVGFSMDLNIPNYFILPASRRIEMDEVQQFMKNELEEKPDSLAGIIGGGDYLIPSILVAATIINTEYPLLAVGSIIGFLAGLIVVSHFSQVRDEALPALPTINFWTLLGTAAFLPVLLF